MVPLVLAPSNVAWTMPPLVDGSPNLILTWSVKVSPPTTNVGSPSAVPPFWQVPVTVPLSVYEPEPLTAPSQLTVPPPGSMKLPEVGL